MEAPEVIKKLIEKAQCPECKARLIFGGWKYYFEYYDLDTLDSDIGKDKSDGYSFECPENNGHNIADVLTIDEQETLSQWLISNC
jgi:hypothetical protein